MTTDNWTPPQRQQNTIRNSLEVMRLRAGLRKLIKGEYDTTRYTPERFAAAVLAGTEPIEDLKP